MASTFKPSPACCSTPAIIGPHYEAQGRWTEIDGTKIYGVGHESAKHALFILYDVFGYSSQILQGADVLAAHGYKVYMPDFWNGTPAPMDWMKMPDDTGTEPPADEAALDVFCNGPGNTEKTIKRTMHLQAKLQSANPSIEKWGIVGYCWGGYMVNFLLDQGTPFAAGAELHPGFPPEKAASITKPVLALCSKDEPEDEYAEFKPHLKVEARFEHFPTMLHGWMSSRGDLSKPEVKKEYDRGYQMVVDWFAKHLDPSPDLT